MIPILPRYIRVITWSFCYRFEEALVPLQKGFFIVSNRSVHLTIHTYPGTRVTVEESKPPKLEAIFISVYSTQLFSVAHCIIITIMIFYIVSLRIVRLQATFENYISLCKYPPNPDAVCKFENCVRHTPNIYLCDPDFKVCLVIILHGISRF